jgi:hypothetical protein
MPIQKLKKLTRIITDHRRSINRPTKREKEKSASDRHYQCEKEMDDHLLACQQILERVVNRLAKERASFLKIND